jgi:hypothetical protein
MKELNLTCEVKKVSSKKTASLDVEYQVVLSTEDSNILKLAELPGDTLIDVTVKVPGNPDILYTP